MRKFKLFEWVLIGFVVGILVGAVWGPGAVALKPIGDLFIRLLKMLIIPLVFSTLVLGTSKIAGTGKMGRVAGKTIVYYIITSAIAVVIGLVIANVIRPGAGMHLDLAGAEIKKVTPPSLADTLLNLVPTNPIGAMAQGQVLPVIVFSLFFGYAITVAGKAGEGIRGFFEGFAEAMYKMTFWIMSFAPFGVFALMATAIGTHGLRILIPYAWLIFAVYLGIFIHMMLVYTPVLTLIGKMGLRKFYGGFKTPMVFAWSTCSSSATLPISMEAARENLGVSTSISSFVQPLGATINMDGTALYQGICALFVAQAFGIALGVGQQIMIVLTAVLASIGTAGVPGAGLIMLTMVLMQVGLPVEAIALIAGVDRILDMARTMCNVTGDATAAVWVAKTEGELVAAPAASSSK